MSRASTAIELNSFIKKNKKIPILQDNVEYITVKEYAEKMRISANTVRCILLGGGIEGAIKIGRRWKIPVYKSLSVPQTSQGAEEGGAG